MKKRYQSIVSKKKTFISKKDKKGLYYYDGKSIVAFESTTNNEDPDPVDFQVIQDDHQYYLNQPLGTDKTEYVNFKVADIAGYYNALQQDHVTPSGFRIKFIRYQNAPTINGSLKPKYVGKMSVALIALVHGLEYDGSPASATKPDTRPRNLGTIHPPD